MGRASHRSARRPREVKKRRDETRRGREEKDDEEHVEEGGRKCRLHERHSRGVPAAWRDPLVANRPAPATTTDNNRVGLRVWGEDRREEVHQSVVSRSVIPAAFRRKSSGPRTKREYFHSMAPMARLASFPQTFRAFS